jgi:hypothetical protein
MFRVDLRTPGLPAQQSPRNLYLRELSGYEELADSGTELINAVLLQHPAACARPGEVSKLSLAEIDRVLAGIYRSLYGDKVESHVRCLACHAVYALSFTLTDLWNFVTQRSAEDEKLLDEIQLSDDESVYRVGHLRFRLPTGEDLAQTAGLNQEDAAEALKKACLYGASTTEDEEILDHAMSLVGPMLDTDLESVCSECGADQAVPFRIDEFLLASLRRESAILAREVHELARTYGWSRREILEMPRNERRQYAALIVAESADGAWS